MLKTITFTLLISFLALGLSATAQQPPSQQQSRHDYKLAKKLAQYDSGTKLDVQLSNGEHHIGTLTASDQNAFVLLDPVSGNSDSISYQDVKRIRPIREEQFAQQLGLAGRGLMGGVQVALITVGTIAIILFVLALSTM